MMAGKETDERCVQSTHTGTVSRLLRLHACVFRYQKSAKSQCRVMTESTRIREGENQAAGGFWDRKDKQKGKQ